MPLEDSLKSKFLIKPDIVDEGTDERKSSEGTFGQPLTRRSMSVDELMKEGRDSEVAEREKGLQSRLEKFQQKIKVSDHLLAPTAANVNAQKAFLEQKDQKSGEFDISKSPKFEVLTKVKSTKYEHVQSRLLNPSPSKLVSKEKDKQEEEDSNKIIKPISPSSHVLKPTNSLVQGSWKTQQENPAPKAESELKLLTSKSGPKVESRLLNATTSTKSGSWKSKEVLEAEERLRIEQELAKKALEPKILRTSDRLLMPTSANENARYQKQLEEQTEKSTVSSRRVASTSPRLLEFTASRENAKYKPKEEPPQSPKKPEQDSNVSAIPLPTRLLAPTVAYEKAKYQKPDNDVDPRELGWKNHHKAKVSDLDNRSVISSRSKSSTARLSKVRETSESVLKLTAAHEYHRKSSPDGSVARSVMSRSQSASRALSASRAMSSSRAISPTSSILKPTISSARSADRKSDFFSDVSPDLYSLAKVYRPEAPKIYKEVPASLMKTTASYRMKSLPDNLSDLSEGSFEDEPVLPADKIKPLNNTEHFLAPTLSSKLHFEKEEEKVKALSKPVKEDASFLAPTAAFSQRFAPEPVPVVPAKKTGPVVKFADTIKDFSPDHFLAPTAASTSRYAESPSKTQKVVSKSKSQFNIDINAAKERRRNSSPKPVNMNAKFYDSPTASSNARRDFSADRPKSQTGSVKNLAKLYSNGA